MHPLAPPQREPGSARISVRTGAAREAGAPRIDSEPMIGLAWLWRLRWAALLGQLAALGVARWSLDVEPHWANVAAALALFAASNVLLGRRLELQKASRRLIVLVLLFDVCLFTGLLFWSGGAANPFSAFYVVNVAIAALMLGPAWAFLLVVLTSLGFGALFFVPASELGPHASHTASLHLRGMLAAYVLSASFVAYFVSRVAAALREREEQAALLRRHLAGMERVASLSTMAAGAAHELGTPLASIAVSARELFEALASEPRWAGYAEEARQIRQEVDRCRSILDRLAMGAGQPAGEAPEWLVASELARRLREELGPVDAAAFELDSGAPLGSRVRCPPRALCHALTNLLRNGIDASRANGAVRPVLLRLSAEGTRACFDILDAGSGISAQALARLGEPFFTTKPAGMGMGLGVYLVGAFVHQVGGELHFEAVAGGGTQARLVLGYGTLEPEPAP